MIVQRSSYRIKSVKIISVLMLRRVFCIKSESHSPVSYVLTIFYYLYTICNSYLGISHYIFYVHHTYNW